MISFTIITDTPVTVRNALVARGIITLQTVDGVAKTPVAVLEGLEWLEVPNPIKASGMGTDLDPYVADTRRCFLVKMAHAAEDDQTSGIVQNDAQGNLKALAQRTKLGTWVIANSSVATIT